MSYRNIYFSSYYGIYKEINTWQFLKMLFNLNFSFLKIYSENTQGFWIETSSHFIHSKLFIIRYTFFCALAVKIKPTQLTLSLVYNVLISIIGIIEDTLI